MTLNYEYVDDPAYHLSEDKPSRYKAAMFVVLVGYISLMFYFFVGIYRVTFIYQ